MPSTRRAWLCDPRYHLGSQAFLGAAQEAGSTARVASAARAQAAQMRPQLLASKHWLSGLSRTRGCQAPPSSAWAPPPAPKRQTVLWTFEGEQMQFWLFGSDRDQLGTSRMPGERVPEPPSMPGSSLSRSPHTALLLVCGDSLAPPETSWCTSTSLSACACFLGWLQVCVCTFVSAACTVIAGTAGAKSSCCPQGSAGLSKHRTQLGSGCASWAEERARATESIFGRSRGAARME